MESDPNTTSDSLHIIYGHKSFNVYNFPYEKGAECTILSSNRTFIRFFIHEIVHAENRLNATRPTARPVARRQVPAAIELPRAAAQAGTEKTVHDV